MSVLYGDDPLSDDGDHSFGTESIVRRFIASLNLLKTRTPSAVVALVGPWGSGKTTIFNRIQESMAADGTWSVITYNPWAYSSLESAVPGFFAEIRSALPDDMKGSSKRKVLGDWISRMAPIGSLGGAVGVDVSGAAKIIGDLLVGDQSPENLRKEAEELLRGLQHPILMLIDDLDRLGPNELLMTFKLVRLLGRMPNVYYLLGYDEKTLQDILMKTGLVAEEKSRARDYLEKMIQLRLDIPSLLPEYRSDLVNAALTEVTSNHGVALSEQDEQRLAKSWSHCVDRYINQPRAVKRLFTQVDATWGDVAGEVDFVDFVLITFIRTFEPSVYALIEERADELLSKSMDYALSRNKESPTQRWDRWIGYLEACGSQFPSHMADLLADLFVPIRSGRSNMEFGSAERTDIALRQGVGHADYFYRYTQIGVPRSDIAEKVVIQCIQELHDGAPGHATATLKAKLIEDPNRVVDKILRQGNGDTLPSAELIRILGQEYESIGTKSNGFLAAPPSRAALKLSEHILTTTTNDRALDLIGVAMERPAGVAMIGDLFRQLHSAKQRGEDSPEWFSEAIPIVCSHIKDVLNSLTSDSTDEENERGLRNFWALRDLTTSDEAKEFLWTKVGLQKLWQIEDILALMIPIGVGPTYWTLGELEAETMESVLGIEKIATILDSQSLPDHTASDQLSSPKFDHRPTVEDRKPFAMASFHQVLRSYRKQNDLEL